jgi:hypothetical protein
MVRLGRLVTHFDFNSEIYGLTGWISITVSPLATFDMLRDFWVDACYLNTVDQICQFVPMSVKKYMFYVQS